MSDIQAGDVVVCVDNAPNERGGRSAPSWLNRGRAYRVTGLTVTGRTHQPACFILNGGGERDGMWLTDRFRKIDKADEQFIRTVRECRPVREGQPA